MENKRDSVIPNNQSAKTPTVQDLGSKAKNGGPDRIQKQLKVLIVDDMPMILKATQRIVGKLGVKRDDTSFAANAKDALRLMEEEKFDLIITDNSMPPGIDGQDMIQLLSKEGKGEILDKIVLQTAEPSDIRQEIKSLLNGRVLNKLSAREEINELTQFLMDGGAVSDWTPREH